MAKQLGLPVVQEMGLPEAVMGDQLYRKTSNMQMLISEYLIETSKKNRNTIK